MGKKGEWDFDAPKFWDLAEIDNRERPTDSWFSKDTISPASFQRPLPSLQPIFPVHNIGLDYLHKKKKLFHRAKVKQTGFEHLHNEHNDVKTNEAKIYRPLEPEKPKTPPLHDTEYSLPDWPKCNNTFHLASLVVTKTTSLSLPTTTALIPDYRHHPITVEMGRNRPYEEERFEVIEEPEKQVETLESEEVKRKYVYVNYDRMYETIKKARLVLEESRQKSEQWRSKKKKL